MTYYLPRTALDATFAALALLADRGRTELVLDYAQHAEALDDASRRYLEIVTARVEKDGEPFVSFFSAGELADMVERHGFSICENLPYPAVYERYTGVRPPAPAGFGAIAHLRCG